MIINLHRTLFALLTLLLAVANVSSAESRQSPPLKSDSLVWQKLISSAYQSLNKPGSEPADLNQAKLLAGKALNFSKERKKMLWQADDYILQSSIPRES